MEFYLLEFNPWIEPLAQFVFWYPFIMALFWIAGAFIFSLTREKQEKLTYNERDWPLISVLIPCYNEEETIAETIKYLDRLHYPHLEIIAVNDGSHDKTGEILIALASTYERLRVIDCRENRGKANALHIAAHAAKSEYLLCVDSDAFLDQDAPYYLMRHFLMRGERLGAVTGNPRIRNRDTLLSRMQLVEYSSIIGSIKRTQRIIGKIMTVSGVIVMFRKKALISVGLWDRDMITEDIAVSWKLQKKFWDIRYEPRAICWMLVPESLSGIWNQRVRWSQGGQEAILRHFDIFTDWRQRRIWPIYIEQVISVIWAYAWLIVTIYLLITADKIQKMLIWFTYNSFALVLISHVQLLISLWNDARYDKVLRYYIWAAWYPAMYWMINTFVVIAATPKAISSRLKGGYATWSSPDRGSRKSNP
ncbi:poly-beta-1,6-N-acetyl-D-glucosamine synthase [Bacillus manliponensis]|uniref:poly-beta-1,6-N-acetyl-D-glucosamine synthase n=1 Tax=Bacillus manliponensis TaxID=574376 RepID=UPI000A4A3E70|nr:poly-beta-1,6-N-acetyl-D-glucosamine synthase [Bacillus manliponensis]